MTFHIAATTRFYTTAFPLRYSIEQQARVGIFVLQLLLASMTMLNLGNTRRNTLHKSGPKLQSILFCFEILRPQKDQFRYTRLVGWDTILYFCELPFERAQEYINWSKIDQVMAEAVKFSKK